MAHAPVHFNGNIMCAIDIETTGLDVGNHDIRELAILVVNPDATINKKIKPFVANFGQKYGGIDENVMSRADTADMINNGMNPDSIAERLEEWFQTLPLKPGKKIVPLGCNYANFDRPFIQDWLGGRLSYEAYFRSDERDVQKMALMINDMADFYSQKIPFPKVGLQYLASCVEYSPERPHTALDDCVTTIEVYRRLMRWKDYHNPMGV